MRYDGRARLRGRVSRRKSVAEHRVIQDPWDHECELAAASRIRSVRVPARGARPCLRARSASDALAQIPALAITSIPSRLVTSRHTGPVGRALARLRAAQTGTDSRSADCPRTRRRTAYTATSTLAAPS